MEELARLRARGCLGGLGQWGVDLTEAMWVEGMVFV